MSDDPGESFADVLNGITGTTRPKGERRGLFRRRGAEPTEPVEEGGSEPDPSTASGDAEGAHAWTSAEAQTAPYGTPTPGPPRHELPEPDQLPAPAEDIAIVRPYAWTGGRTRPTYDLEIETLVSVASGGRDPSHLRQYEHRAVAELCREPRSVAEVAALLTLPLGVARVLIGDMASQGTVVVHQTASSSDSSGVPDTALMEGC